MLAVCAGCDDGGGGDPLSEPVIDSYGTGARLSDLLGPAVWFDASNEDAINCKIPSDREVHVTGATVTARDDFDETGDGQIGNVYMQDSFVPAIEYSGITVFEPAFSPPDLRVVEGDVMDLVGFFTEFPGPSSFKFNFCRTLPETSGAMELRFDAGGVEPLELEPKDLAGYENARRYFGMLVKVNNVTITNCDKDTDGHCAEDDNGRFAAEFDVGGGISQQDVPTISNELFDVYENVVIDEQMTLKSVTGIVTFFFATHVAPRSSADLVF